MVFCSEEINVHTSVLKKRSYAVRLQRLQVQGMYANTTKMGHVRLLSIRSDPIPRGGWGEEGEEERSREEKRKLMWGRCRKNYYYYYYYYYAKREKKFDP